MESIFESYLEVHNAVWSAHGCSIEECDIFVLDYIFLRRQQNGAKMSSYVEL